MDGIANETISLAPSGKNGSVSYGLDPVGNRGSETSTLSGISSGSFSFNADDEFASETNDQNGNVTASSGKTFGYNSQNQMISMTASGTSATITYDGDGNRVAKTVGGVTTHYLVDDLNPTGYAQVIDELTGSTASRIYTYGLQRINENQPISGSWTPSFYGYDGGGSVRQLTSAAGAVTDSYEYDAYGNSFTVSGSTPNEMMYRGEQYDSDLGLYYLRARYYNPLTGRFMSRDPNDPQLRSADGIPTDPRYLHKFLYANGDPINGIDPSGRGPLLDTVVLYTSIVLPIAATAATAASYALCIVHSSSDLASAIQVLSSVRNPFSAIRCALNLLESIGNEPFLNWPWNF